MGQQPSSVETSATSALLAISELSKSFGGLQAVKDVTLDCAPGETLGIIGPNGAGKTTVFNLITGFTKPDRGLITFKGEEITHRPPAQICRHGIARTFQGIRLFRSMSVWENVWLGQNERAQYLLPFAGRNGAERALRDEVDALLDEFHLYARRDHIAGELAFGDMRRLEICRALATKPDLLLLDEPASGLSPVETAQLMEDLRRLAKSGLSIVLIEHDMNVALGLSDRVIVLNFGQQLAQGTPAEIRQNTAVIEAYLGSAAGAGHA
ncbi:MAG: ABC transporter ATP-binding protein [Methyloligellaceae bacterium]